MDRKLLDILACPATRQPLALLESRGLGALNEAIAAGGSYQKVAVPLALQLQGRALNPEVPAGNPLGLARAGGIHRIDGSPQTDSVREALVTRDRKLAYRVDDGIPVLLVDEGIALGQVPDFPAA